MRERTKPLRLLTRLYISETYVAPVLTLKKDFTSRELVIINYAILLPRGIDIHTFRLNVSQPFRSAFYIEVGDGTKVSPAIKRHDYLLPPPLQSYNFMI